MKMTSEQRKNYKSEILSWIEDENNLEAAPLDKVKYLFDCYESEAGENTKFYGSYQEGLKNWLQGLPSCIPGMPFSNYDILQLAHNLGGIEATPSEAQAWKLISNYFHFISAYLMQLKAMTAKQLEKFQVIA